MEDQLRPDPDALLRIVSAREERAQRGRLKLFFGANAGVGKTYAMLEAAQERRREGVDVVVGVVETHGRTETAALLEGLEVLPRRKVEYHGTELTEFDLDAALARRPALILVDELAHTNAPGSRHARRWQDVEELLHAGVDVYSALNVQHWESLNDVVAQVTGVVVRETVPDSFLEQVTSLELVDLPPEDLLKRLAEGKVYRGDQAAQAAQNFFSHGNLIALRELALRLAAERVEDQIVEFREEHAIAPTWKVSDRLLVSVSPSPLAARLVRATARMARRLRAEWIAAHVETPGLLKLSETARRRVLATMRMAEQLGAETVILSGDRPAEEIASYARARNVSRIVVGKPARPRWRDWLGGSFINEIARRAGEIDLLVVSGVGSSLEERRERPQKRSPSWSGLPWVILGVALQTVAYLFTLRPLGQQTSVAFLYLLGVVLVAYFYGRRVAIVASVLSVLAYDFFFVPPYLTLYVYEPHFVTFFIVMLIVGVAVSTLTGRLRARSEALRRRSLRTEALYRLSRSLSTAPDLAELGQAAARHLADYYRAESAVLLPDANGRLEVAAGNVRDLLDNPRERGAAQWVFDRGQVAGRGTLTLAAAEGRYLPLRGRSAMLGVLALRSAWLEDMDMEQEHLLETFAVEIGAALESTQLAETAGRAAALAETERMRTFILSRFSAELHAPLRQLAADMDRMASADRFDRAELSQARNRLLSMYGLTGEMLRFLAPEVQDAGAAAGSGPSSSTPDVKGEPQRPSVVDSIDRRAIAVLPNRAPLIEVAGLLVERLGLRETTEWSEMLESERVAPTRLTRDVVLPHARLPNLDRVVSAIAICPAGIELPEGEIAHVCLLFASPTHEPGMHVAFLAQLARLFQDRQFPERLCLQHTADEILTLLRASETKLAGGS